MVRGTEVVTFLLAGSFSAGDVDFLYGQHLNQCPKLGKFLRLIFPHSILWVVLLCGFTFIKFREVAVRRPGKLQHSTVSCFYRVQYAFVDRLSVKGAQPHFFLTYSATPLQPLNSPLPAPPRSPTSTPAPTLGPLGEAGGTHCSLSPISFPPWQWYSHYPATWKQTPKLTSVCLLPNDRLKFAKPRYC